MQAMYENGMHTSFDTLKEDMSIAAIKGTQYDGEFRDRACFAPLRDMLKLPGAPAPSNEVVRYVRYYPWIKASLQEVPGYMEAVQAYLDVLHSIPFVRERIIDSTGYALHDGRESNIDTEKYYLVDMKVPVDEGFAILQMLRIPQEFPGQIKTFHDTVKRTGCERTAFLAALLYTNSKGGQITGGHHPSNGMTIKWAHEFINDPGIAKSQDNRWSSDVMGGGQYCNLTYDDFLAGLNGGDPCLIPVAVYGSLRKGLGNHRLLAKAMKEGGARAEGSCLTTVPAQMYSLGAFPALHPTPDNHQITFELFRVNKATLASLDALEGYPNFYDRTQILISYEPYWVYFQHKQPSETVVESGDWVEWLQSKRKRA